MQQTGHWKNLAVEAEGEVEVDPSDLLTGRAAWGGDLGL